MQDTLRSLNGENADVGHSGMRKQIWTQRLYESQGGVVGDAVSTQWGVTAGLVTYARLRAGGFRMLPYAVAKTTSYSAVFFAAATGYYAARFFVTQRIGDEGQACNLMKNRSAMLAGEMPL